MAKVGYIFCNSLCLFWSFVIFVLTSWCSDLINHDIMHHLLIIMLPYSKGSPTDNQRTDQPQHIISDLLKLAFAKLARLVEINVALKKMTCNGVLVFSIMIGRVPYLNQRPEALIWTQRLLQQGQCHKTFLRLGATTSALHFLLFSALVPARKKKKKEKILAETLKDRCKTDTSHLQVCVKRHMKGIAGSPRLFADCGLHRCSAT